MPAKASADDVHQALLQLVTDDSFAQSKGSTAAKSPPTAAGVENISNARKEAEREIRALGRDTPSDADSWITQAKQLHEEIERSKVTAKQIVTQHEKSQALQDQVNDAAAKVELLNNEITFNQSLSEALEAARGIDRKMSATQAAIDQDQPEQAIELLDNIEDLINSTPLQRNTHVNSILATKASDLRDSIGASLNKQWDHLVRIDQKAGSLTIMARIKEPFGVKQLLPGLSKQGILDKVIESFRKTFFVYILRPVLLPGKTPEHRLFAVEQDHIQLISQPKKPDVSAILNAILSAFKFLNERLPSEVTTRLFPALIATVIPPLISGWLTSAIPIAIPDMNSFQQVLEDVRRFSQELQALGYSEPEELTTWIKQIPRHWLAQRRIRALDEVRVVVSRRSGDTRQVERVEKQIVSQSDDMFQENTGDDEWNAGWESEDDSKDAPATDGQPNDDEDVSAWGLDDDEPKPTVENGHTAVDDDDINESWGWDDDETEDTGLSTIAPQPVAEPPKQRNSQRERSSLPSQQEVTLKELYTITNVPDAIIEIISDQISDSELLKQPENATLQLGPSGPALLGLPTLVMAMYKAIAPVFYSRKFTANQMYLYNDSMYLAENLRLLSEKHNVPKLKPEVDSIEKFGRMAYGREMHSQRTILTDLLDGCQGFASCTAQPYLGECERAIAATVDRTRDVHKDWQSILSHSALLQSIGSLLATGVNKIITDIEDLSDISEPESQRLASFCSHISNLEYLFLPDAPDEGSNQTEEPIPLTAIYVPNWLKFQYLINILEGSLADIKYMWAEGELKLEFSGEEVVDLIQALFADSDHRKKAITEIRGSS